MTNCKNPKAVSILVRAGSEHVADEIERNLDDAIGVVSLVFKDGKIVTGGGAAEIELALKLRKTVSFIHLYYPLKYMAEEMFYQVISAMGFKTFLLLIILKNIKREVCSCFILITLGNSNLNIKFQFKYC